MEAWEQLLYYVIYFILCMYVMTLTYAQYTCICTKTKLQSWLGKNYAA